MQWKCRVLTTGLPGNPQVPLYFYLGKHIKETSGYERPDLGHSQEGVLGTCGKDEELEREVGALGARLWSLNPVLQQLGSLWTF